MLYLEAWFPNIVVKEIQNNDFLISLLRQFILHSNISDIKINSRRDLHI